MNISGDRRQVELALRAAMQLLVSDPFGVEFIIASVEDAEYYVQFVAGNGLYAEAVGNASLSARNTLSRDQLATLERIGWSPPPSHLSGTNWWTEFSVADENALERTVQLALTTLFEVYGVSGKLVITSGGLSDAELEKALGI